MKLQNLRRTGGLAVTAVALSVSLVACGDDATESTTSDSTASSTPSEEPAEEPAEEETTEASAGDQTFGEGCAAVPTSGDGSFDGMVQDPVATAASNNPLLGTLVTAVGEAGLVDTLNNAEALTVFAPTDDAFAAVPKKALNGLLADKEALTGVLTHHVLAGQIAPDAIAGTQETLAGDTLEISGDAEQGVTIENAGGPANVICGNIPTANATVYVVDSVLMPTA